MSVRVVFVAALIAAAPQATVLADGNAEAGAAKSAICSACHGPNGHSVNPLWPNLAGQHASYIFDQVKAIQKGEKRANPTMQPIVTGMSDDDIRDISAYYATQTEAGLEADPSYWKSGQKIYRGGIQERNVPACTACHGPIGRGNDPGKYPALRAQHAEYTLKQLNDYKSGERKTGPGNIMQTIASRLSEEEMRDLASYIQGLR